MARPPDYERSGAGPIVDTYRRLEAKHTTLLAALAALEAELRELSGDPDVHVRVRDLYGDVADKIAALRTEHSQP